MLDYGGFHRLNRYYDMMKLPVSKNDMNLLSHHFWFDKNLEVKMFADEIVKLSGVPTGIRPWKLKILLESFKDPKIFVPLILTFFCVLCVRFEKIILVNLTLMLGIQLFFALMGRPGERLFIMEVTFIFSCIV